MKRFLVGVLVMSGCCAFAQTGIGSNSCGAWIKARSDNGPAKGYAQVWMSGFMVGMHAMDQITTGKKGVLANTDAASMYLYIDNYCKENPLDGLEWAGTKLFIELRGKTKDK